MKKNKLPVNIILSMIMLSISLVVLWIIFYYATLGMIRRNMRLQTETSSDAIISAVEEKLQTLENTAFELSHDPQILKICTSKNTLSFYDAAASYDRKIKDADNAVLFRSDGSYYRMKGNISNTTLKRCFYLMEQKNGYIVTVTSNNNSYICSYRSVISDNSEVGAVAALIDRSRIERILGMFNDLDYLGVALLSSDHILCSNRDIQPDDLNDIRTDALYVKEKGIGLSGCKLLVWCDGTLSESLSSYFRIALPVTIAILIPVIIFFMFFLRRSVATAIELDKERTLLSLLKKQISAHFTVNTLNVVRALINKDDKEAAANICNELSTLLRYANAGDEYISLPEEFFVLRQYIGIMQARYPDKIDVDIEDDDLPDEHLIPRMLLQPVIENAITHGLEGKKGTIRIYVEDKTDHILIHICDNGKGISPEDLEELRQQINSSDSLESHELEHVALKNIQRRIHMVCGEEYGITISSEKDKGSEVCLKLP